MMLARNLDVVVVRVDGEVVTVRPHGLLLDGQLAVDDELPGVG